MLVTKHCGNHFTVYVSQSIILSTLILYNDVCKLYLNKTGGKSQKQKSASLVSQFFILAMYVAL